MSDDVVTRAWHTLSAAHPALPRRDELQQEIADAEAAQARGYYLPDEDERLREVYVSYLSARAALWEMVHELRPYLQTEDPRVFGLAFCAAAMLVRSGSFVIGLAQGRPVVWKKLDEAEPRFGLERKSFTRVYRSISSVRWMWRYQDAMRYYDDHRSKIHEALSQAEMDDVTAWLTSEEPFFEKSRRAFWQRRFAYRLHSFLRRSGSSYKRVMFQLFRLSGCAIADMKQPFKRSKEKRVTDTIREETRASLKPGDVIVTRHRDAMSNLFLPGYWPHAALYLGSPEHDVLEAKKDGVRFRDLNETLAVDAFVVMRPKLSSEEIKEALDRARTHAGKLYDFVFDFRKADRLVCTEVVYRAYHSIGPMAFELAKQSGRLVLSAEDLLRQSLEKELFEVVAIFGVTKEILIEKEPAHAVLLESLRQE